MALTVRLANAQLLPPPVELVKPSCIAGWPGPSIEKGEVCRNLRGIRYGRIWSFVARWSIRHATGYPGLRVRQFSCLRRAVWHSGLLQGRLPPSDSRAGPEPTAATGARSLPGLWHRDDSSSSSRTPPDSKRSFRMPGSFLESWGGPILESAEACDHERSVDRRRSQNNWASLPETCPTACLTLIWIRCFSCTRLLVKRRHKCLDRTQS